MQRCMRVHLRVCMCVVCGCACTRLIKIEIAHAIVCSGVRESDSLQVLTHGFYYIVLPLRTCDQENDSICHPTDTSDVNTKIRLSRNNIIQPCRIGDDGKPHPVESVMELQEGLGVLPTGDHNNDSDDHNNDSD